MPFSPKANCFLYNFSRIYDLNVVVIASEVLSLRDYFDFVLEGEKSQFINLLAYQVNYCKWV